MLKTFKKSAVLNRSGLMQAAVFFLFLFPLFFQLSGSIFNAKEAIFDSRGDLLLLPLPLASVICFVGIALLLRLSNSHYGMGFIFSFFSLMMLSAIVMSGGESSPFELSKFIHLIQFLLPTFALVLGQLYRKPNSVYLSVEAVILYVLLIIIPLEVIATIYRGNVLAANLYLFSMYQHYQYMPVLFAAFFLIATATLYEKSALRFLIVFLAPWMGVYIAQALSVNAMALALLGAVVLVWTLRRIEVALYAFALVVLVGAAFFLYRPYVQNTQAYVAKFNSTTEMHDVQASTMSSDVGDKVFSHADGQGVGVLSKFVPKNIAERFGIWQFYIYGIIENPKTFLFGHRLRPDRSKYPSAHNYYLDLVYNILAWYLCCLSSIWYFPVFVSCVDVCQIMQCPQML
jgi:hypothetical protein